MTEKKVTIIETNHSEETFQAGKRFGETAKQGQIFCLSGELGVGKTVFTQGFAAGLGIMEPVNSPTFTVLQEYMNGRLPLYHFDVYRIEDVEEMEEIGYEDCFFGEGVCMLEWAELIRSLIPEDAVWIKIEREPEKGFDYRKITVIE